jgi:DNA polymerase-3 subunit epsilon
MREIVLDTETTGLDPLGGDRLIEIGCIELDNRFPTGRIFHKYLNPDRSVPASAVAIHGITDEDLKDKPRFADICQELIEFIGEAPLVAHNAAFDLGFLNAELERCGRTLIGRERLVDTLLLARRRNPAGPNSLDQLCIRYGVDLSRRIKHGALLDAELLSEVYVELVGGRQASLVLVEASRLTVTMTDGTAAVPPRPVALAPRLSPQEREAHLGFIATLGDKAIWRDYEVAA